MNRSHSFEASESLEQPAGFGRLVRSTSDAPWLCLGAVADSSLGLGAIADSMALPKLPFVLL